jgi:hypothetical protein
VRPVMPRGGTWCISPGRGSGWRRLCRLEFAEALEGMSEQDARELPGDLADGAAARGALAEPGESVSWEQVRAEAGL